MNTENEFLDRFVDAEEAARRCIIERMRGGVLVFTNGVFDLLHRGHLEYLQAAAKLGSRLIVGLNSDESARRLKGPHRPLVTQEDRAVALLSLRCVDLVVLFEEDTPARVIETIKPHVLVKGGDYSPDEIVGADFVRRHGGRVETIPFRAGYSTSAFIEQIVERCADSCLKT